MNYWKQLTHVLKYFAQEENPNAKLPHSFMEGFLEVSSLNLHYVHLTYLYCNRAGINVTIEMWNTYTQNTNQSYQSLNNHT